MTTKADSWDLETLALRAGTQRSDYGEHSEALFLTSSFVFDSAEQAEERFSGRAPGPVYSRFNNPGVAMFEQRLCELEGGEACVATASGMAAILALCMSTLRAGDHILAAEGLFGTTTGLFNNYLSRFGVATTFVPVTEPSAWEKALRANTRMLFLETPSNPLMDIADLGSLAQIARKSDALLVVDNTLCTPVLQNPLSHGAHVVIHSATKYIDGQGRCVGGAVVGDAETVGKQVFGFIRSGGPGMSPFNAWVFLKGLETMPLRMRHHSEQALALAQWLQEQKGVRRIIYPGLESHPGNRLASRQQNGFGGILSFEIEGQREEAWRFIDAMRMISITGNLGDSRSILTHPATTTHGRLSLEEREKAGISEGLLRLSVGFESQRDLKADLSLGLAR